jgi:hypothetical protein
MKRPIRQGCIPHFAVGTEFVKYGLFAKRLVLGRSLQALFEEAGHG